MTELEKAARIALEALRHGVSQLNGIGIPMEADPLHTAIAALTQALATAERKGEPVYQICMADSVSISTAWVDVGKEAYDDAGLYPEYRKRTLYTSPQVPEDVIVILDECRTALMECDRDCDYELIDRAYAALDAARKGSDELRE